MYKTLKTWFHDVFPRDVDITIKGFMIFLVAYIFFFISIELVLISIFKFLTIPYLLIFIVTIIISLVCGGIIVDHYKNRTNLLLICSIIIILAIFLLIFQNTVIEVIGLIFLLFATITFIIDLQTIYIHESTILFRGRLAAYLLILSILIATGVLALSFLNVFIILSIIIAIFLFYKFYLSKEYSYIESKERLKSDFKFSELILKNPIRGYLIAFLLLGIIIGYSFSGSYSYFVSPFGMILLVIFFLFLIGAFLDNQGRKWSFTACVFVISIIIIFEGLFSNIYNDLLFGVSIPLVLVLLATFTGDFVTERNIIKYRGRIFSFFSLLLIFGLICGIIIKIVFIGIETSFPEISWFSDIRASFNSFLIVILLIWIMPLHEILSAKEADWAETIKNLYVFNKDSICLYYKDFNVENENNNLPCEDLVTSGLTGVMSLISEITNEQKNLRIIDKEGVKIYFTYGKHINIALISTKYLPILFIKMEKFMKSFEKHFEQDLIHFNGKINNFQKKTEELTRIYFKFKQ